MTATTALHAPAALPTWFGLATSIPDDWDALEAASGDVPYIFEGDEVGAGSRWYVATIPLEHITAAPCRETGTDRKARLAVIRAVPPEQLCRPILDLVDASSCAVIDGAHRLDVARERGLGAIEALVRIVVV